MNNCGNYQNYFDYLSECLEKFQMTETSNILTSTEIPESLHSESLETQMVTMPASAEDTLSTTESSEQKVTSSQFFESLMTQTEPLTQVMTTSELFTETEMTSESSDRNFNILVTLDNHEGSSGLESIVKSVQTAEFNYLPSILITAGGWFMIAIFVFICLKYKKRYRVINPSPDISLDYIPFQKRKSKKSRSERDRIVNDSVISPADDPISIV